MVTAVSMTTSYPMPQTSEALVTFRSRIVRLPNVVKVLDCHRSWLITTTPASFRLTLELFPHNMLITSNINKHMASRHLVRRHMKKRFKRKQESGNNYRINVMVKSESLVSPLICYSRLHMQLITVIIRFHRA